MNVIFAVQLLVRFPTGALLSSDGGRSRPGAQLATDAKLELERARWRDEEQVLLAKAGALKTGARRGAPRSQHVSSIQVSKLQVQEAPTRLFSFR